MKNQYDSIFDSIDKIEFENCYLNSSLKDVMFKYNICENTVNNWARKLLIPRKKIQWKDIEYKLNNYQKSILYGSLLGDGCLLKVKNEEIKYEKLTCNSRFSERHCIAQHDWLVWKQKQIEPIPSLLYSGESSSRIMLSNNVIVSDNSRMLKFSDLKTVQHPIFTEMEYIWYKRDRDGKYVYNYNNGSPRRIKIVPLDLKIDPLMLSVWYLDDGTNSCEKKYCNIFSLGYSKEEVDYLLSIIKNIGFTHSNIYKNKNKEQYYIHIKSRSYLDFINYVTVSIPDIPECMKYKIDLTYYKISWRCFVNYHKRSKLHDDLLDKIMIDIKNNLSKIKISQKYNISKYFVSKLIKGKIPDKTSLVENVSYGNKCGTKGVTFDKVKQKYCVAVTLRKNHGDKRNKTISLGSYSEKELACIIANKSYEMRDNGIIDASIYKEMALMYVANKDLYI